MTSPGCRYVPFALNSPAVLSRQRASRKHRHYSPAWLDYPSTATRRILHAQVCTRTHSEADPLTETVFVTRWIKSSLLLDSVHSLISVRLPDYLWGVVASRRASSLATGRLSTARRTIHEGCPHAVSEISKICVKCGWWEREGRVKR